MPDHVWRQRCGQQANRTLFSCCSTAGRGRLQHPIGENLNGVSAGVLGWDVKTNPCESTCQVSNAGVTVTHPNFCSHVIPIHADPRSEQTSGSNIRFISLSCCYPTIAYQVTRKLKVSKWNYPWENIIYLYIYILIIYIIYIYTYI